MARFIVMELKPNRRPFTYETRYDSIREAVHTIENYMEDDEYSGRYGVSYAVYDIVSKSLVYNFYERSVIR